MEKLDNKFSKFIGKVKPLIFTLSLALGANFAYSQTNPGANSNKMEQTSESQERNIVNFKNKIQNRYKDFLTTTNETLDQYIGRLKDQLVGKNGELSQKEIIEKKYEIMSILNSKYPQYVQNNDEVSFLRSAFEVLSNISDKYYGLDEFLSDKSDYNLISAIQFVQYMNKLKINGSLKGGVLDTIIRDLKAGTNNNAGNNLIAENNNGNNQGNVQNKPNVVANNETPSNTTTTTVINENKDGNAKPEVQPNDNLLNDVSILSKHLKYDKLNGINYEDVLDMINSIKHDGLRNAVRDCLMNNDVVGAQRLLGMDINCDKNKYPDFVASSRLGQRELRLMEKHGQYMTLRDSQEVLNYFESIEQDYKESDATFQKYEPLSVYKKFLEGKGRFNNHGLPYCIVSKYDYTLYLFSADHKLILETPILAGAHVGNKPNVPNKVKTTPGGFYHIGLFCDKTTSGGNLFSLYHSDFIVTLPDDGQYELKTDANGNYIYVLGIHGEGILRGYKVVIGANGKRTLVEVPRSELYDLYEPGCRNTSLGCTNVQVQRFGILRNYLKIGSKYYVCFDDEINNNDLGYTQGNSIEVIEHFGYSPDNTIDRDIAQLDDDSIESEELISKNNLVHNSIKELVKGDLPERYNIFGDVTSTTKKNINNVLAINNRYSSNKHQYKHAA